MTPFNRLRVTSKWLAVGLVLIALGLLTFIGNRLPGQLDLTAARIYTLSPASRTLIAGLDEPVTLNFYFSRSIDGLPIRFKNYAAQVEDLLRQYVRHSNGRIQLVVTDPRPDTREEELALRAGLSGQPLATGANLFFGLQATLADSVATIPMFTMEREAFLEFDISQLVYQVQQWSKPVLGLITGLPLDGPAFQPGMPPPQGAERWAIIDELRKTYTVRTVAGDEIPADIDVLLVIHPESPSETLQYAIDQFLLAGKPVLLVVDPSSVHMRNSQGQQSMMMGMPPAGISSDLPRLLSSWGIEFDSRQVVGDPAAATQVSVQRGAPPTPFAAWLSLTQFDRSLPALASVNSLLFAEAGAVRLRPGSDLMWQPLVETSAGSGVVNAQQLAFMRPEDINRQLQAVGEPRTLAAIAQGTFNTAFPAGRPAPAAAGDEADLAAGSPAVGDPLVNHRASGSGTLLVMGDSDFLADSFSVRVMNLFGMRALTPLNDNLALMVNLIDSLAGNPALIALRGKGSANRPFTRIEALEREAQQRYQTQLETLESRLQAVQLRIQQLQQGQEQQMRLVASPETLAAIEQFRVEEAHVRAEQREIRKRLREDIESLNLRLAMVNLLLMPALVGIGGCVYFWNRHRRR
jgi:ABC-type uncharacterized transport system involved in gliding motility auxiliary subunit